MYYKARYYSLGSALRARLWADDPGLGRFVSADTIVPGAASGAGGGVTTLGYSDRTRLTPLTVNLSAFVLQINAENREVAQFGAFFQWEARTRREHNVPMGPGNPQALNRYAYVLNNPLRYVDPSGYHEEFGNRFIGGEQVVDEQGEVVRVQGQHYTEFGMVKRKFT